VEYGGGVRSVANIESALAAGVDRVMVGTAAFTDAAFLAVAVRRWADRLLVAVDIRGGKVAVRGWHATLDVTLQDAIALLHDNGVQGVVYTDTERDGTLEGADTGRLTAACDACRELGVFLHFAGGVRDVEDIRRLKAYDAATLRGVITGKAVYEGTLDLAEAIRLAGAAG
jgi:phosphoribosylformimino-5-aminoimidazole carboxamide ribotide isomerase